MKLLLDTHVWLWTVTDPDRLAPAARDAIEDGTSSFHLSSISWWELSLLAERGRIDFGGDLDAWFAYATREYPLVELPITSDIARWSCRVSLPHHDPADRFIAATAHVHDLVLVTRDAHLLACPDVTSLQA